MNINRFQQYREVAKMSIDHETGQASRMAADNPVADEVAAPSERRHRDQYPHYTHELVDEDAEASSRALIRFVPLAYGLLLGGLVDNMVLGLLGGAALSTAFDLFMGGNSMVRAFARGAFPYVCPALAAMARGLAGAIHRSGLTAPSNLREMRCEVPRF